MKTKLLITLIASCALLNACKKDDAPTPSQPPVTEPLAITAAKAGDTLLIKGENFSTTAANNIVKINGTTATVHSATTTELKVVIPAGATSGKITVTVDGHTTEAGELTINPFMLLCYKRNYQDLDKYVRQVISIDPATGNESLLFTFSPTTPDVYFEDIVYSSATNEVIGTINFGREWFKINVATKQTSSSSLTANHNIDFRELVTDRSGNIYALKHDYSVDDHRVITVVKMDPTTSVQMLIKGFELNDYWESLVYLPTTNELAGLVKNGTRLFKFNLTSKDTSSVALSASSDIEFRELVTDKGGKLYAYKGDYSDPDNYQSQLVQITPATGQQTMLAILQLGDDKIQSNLVYLPATNEIAAILGQTSFFKFNLTTKAPTTKALTTEADITYGDILSN